jgi:6-pyruvoyltetrahydropterin/6-carboxytetrahydropterin synthase
MTTATMTRIAKEYRWEMGHRLVQHQGLCKNIHGHSYTLRVEIEGNTDTTGMVMDFYDLSALVQPIVDELDHCFICDDSDSVMLEFFLNHPMKVVVVPFPTTAENICAWFADRLTPEFLRFERLRSFTLRLHETERAYAECSRTLRSE